MRRIWSRLWIRETSPWPRDQAGAEMTGLGRCSGACAQGRGGPASDGGSRPSCPSRLPPPHPGDVTGAAETPEQ